MIAGQFHAGSGLGNQLFRYITTRTIAEDKGFEWGMVNPHLFKGLGFMDIDMGQTFDPHFHQLHKTFIEKKVVENGVDVRGYDPEVNFIEDETLIDGEFQDQDYWEHRLGHIKYWLNVEPLDLPDNLCVIGFRGGEYKIFPDLFLTKEYWDEAIRLKRIQNPDMRFEVHTDDVITAQQFFPDFSCVHDIGLNWRSIRYASHLIIANSSFYIMPALLNENLNMIIAPRYWARRNTRTWALPQNFYDRFTYI